MDAVAADSAFSDIFAQRILPDGRIAPGWPENGFPVCTAYASQFDLVACADDLGGVLATWTDSRQEGPGGTEPRIYAQRVLPDARVAPGWTIDGVRASSAEHVQLHPSIAADGAGGAFVAVGDGTIQHITAAGLTALGWPSQGKLLGAGSRPAMVADGEGGVFAAWESGNEIHAMRLDSNGDPVSGWPSGGLVAATGPEAFVARIILDGSGGVYIGMLKHFEPTDIFIQHLDAHGTRPAGWPAEGIGVCTAPGGQFGPAMVTDGSGGLFAGWFDYRNVEGAVFVSHVASDGTLVPGWPVDGLQVGDPGFGAEPSLIGDATGGVLVGLTQQTRGAVVHHLTSGGRVAPGWPASGVELCSRHLLFDPELLPDGQGGAYVAVQDTRDTLQTNLYATYIRAGGAVPVRVANLFARAERGRVRLRWDGGFAPGSLAAVERLAPHDTWRVVAQVAHDTSGWSYTDTDVAEGGVYRYRLIVTDEDPQRGLGQWRVGEVRVVVPSSLKLSLVIPRPVTPDLLVTMALPEAGETSLEVFDIAGRRVQSVRLGIAGPGISTVALDPGFELRTGVYFVRMKHLRATLTARAVLIR